jgi:AraC-like DNA-binding protein
VNTYYPQVEAEGVWQNNQLVSLAYHLYNELNAKEDKSSLIIDGIVYQMLGLTMRGKAYSSRYKPHWMDRVEEFIQAEISRKVSLNEIAAVVKLSPVYLSGTFRKYHGKTISAYRMEVRLRLAMERLKMNSENIAEIAKALGFSDTAHLSRTFKLAMGMPPREFRSLECFDV